MKSKTSNSRMKWVIAASSMIVLGAAPATAQDSVEDLVRTLAGQKAVPETVAPDATEKPKTRGLGLTTRGVAPTTRGISPTTRGISPTTRGVKPAAVKKETRSVLFSATRGIPQAIQAAEVDSNLKVSTTTATKSTGAGDYSVAAGEKAVEVKYDVDPSSKVSKDNILFQKGSANFADQNSLNVVLQLAQAFQHSSLAGLKFVIEGHASAEGSAYANQTLSQKRAEQIVYVLNSRGVASDRLVPIGFGETQARYHAGTGEYLLAQDRRVVIYRLDN